VERLRKARLGRDSERSGRDGERQIPPSRQRGEAAWCGGGESGGAEAAGPGRGEGARRGGAPAQAWPEPRGLLRRSRWEPSPMSLPGPPHLRTQPWPPALALGTSPGVPVTPRAPILLLSQPWGLSK
jgi:hypothetical protein